MTLDKLKGTVSDGNWTHELVWVVNLILHEPSIATTIAESVVGGGREFAATFVLVQPEMECRGFW